jgi:hypothetical protein
MTATVHGVLQAPREAGDTGRPRTAQTIPWPGAVMTVVTGVADPGGMATAVPPPPVTGASSISYPAGLGVAYAQQQAAGHERGGGPSGGDAKTGAGAEGQTVEIGGGLDGEPGVHRPDLLEQALPCGFADHLGEDGEKVEQAEDDPDAGRGVPHEGSDADAEQGDQGQVAGAWTLFTPLLGGGPQDRTEYYSADPDTTWRTQASAPEQPYNNAFPDTKTPVITLGRLGEVPTHHREHTQWSWFTAPVAPSLYPLNPPSSRTGDRLRVTFHSQHIRGDTPSILPMLIVGYDVPADDTNRTGSRRLTLHVRHPAGTKETPLKNLTLAVSYDNGATWTNETVKQKGQDYVATLHGKGPVSLKAGAEDTGGNTISQQITRAYEIR